MDKYAYLYLACTGLGCLYLVLYYFRKMRQKK